MPSIHHFHHFLSGFLFFSLVNGNLLRPKDGPALLAQDDQDYLRKFSHAFVTSGNEKDFSIDAVKVLHRSLVSAGHEEPLFVITSSHERHKKITKLRARLVKALKVGSICEDKIGPKLKLVHDDAEFENGRDATRLIPFSFYKMESLIYIELGSIVNQSIGELFHEPAFSAVLNSYHESHTLSLFVIRPNRIIFQIFQRYHCEEFWGDRNILRSVVSEKVWRTLPDVYGLQQEMVNNMWYTEQDIVAKVVKFDSAPLGNIWRNRERKNINFQALRLWAKFAEGKRLRTCEKIMKSARNISQLRNPSNLRRLTVVIENESRWKCLKAGHHYARMDLVKQVIILADGKCNSSRSERKMCGKVQVFDKRKFGTENCLHMSDYLSDAVFIVRGDILVSEDNLKRGFDIWKVNTRKLVGFTPVLYKDGVVAPNPQTLDGYNFLATHGLFVHRLFLYAYSAITSRKLLAIAEGSVICRDALLNMVVTGLTGTSSLALQYSSEKKRILRFPKGSEFFDRGLSKNSAKCIVSLLSNIGAHEVPKSLGQMSTTEMKNREK